MKRKTRKQVGTMAPDSTDPMTTATHIVADDISGTQIRATAEEIDAVQVFARRLVEDYGYSKNQIQTHPPYRIRVQRSDNDRSLPVDIAVFRSSNKTADELFMVVECRKRERKDGEHQLRLYLDISAAEVGVWFNGSEHLYLRKIHHKNGRHTCEVLPNIPRQGQRIDDIGLLRRKDLRKPSNLKAVFRDLRNHLAGMTRGITRDETLAQEMINLLFCKMLDEQETAPDETVTFRASVGESPEDIQKRIQTLFERVKGATCGDIFNPRDTIRLDPDSLTYVVGELQNYCIMEADRDAIGDAFEVFIGPALRGSEGQFFTPRNVVEMMVKIIDPRPGERIIDPACGSGGFLVHALAHVCSQPHGNTRHKEYSNEWSEAQPTRCRYDVAHSCFLGIEKDTFLAKVSQAYISLIGDGRGDVFCANSLEPFEDWPAAMRQKISPGSFDVVLTNPPFGKKIVVRGDQLLAQFELGHRWKRDRETGALEKTTTLHEDQPPQILFLERCLQLLKPGGRLGIVLPEAVFGMPTYEYVVSWLRSNAKIRGVVSLPEALFKTSGKGGTHAKVCVLFVENTKPGKDEDHAIFMADVKWCGHDSRGNPTVRKEENGELVVLDDIPLVQQRYVNLKNGVPGPTRDPHGFLVLLSRIRNGIFIPKYYDPQLEADINALRHTHNLVSLGDLCKGGKDAIISWDTGIETGKMAYGTGDIPFVRTSDISNWELKSGPKQNVSEEIYEAHRQDVRAGDIFVVRDGTCLVGVSCILTEKDTRILYCGGLYRLRVAKPEQLDPYLLLALLNAPIVRRQMRARQFTRDIIDTLGKRLFEVLLPVPKDVSTCARIAQETREVIETRAKLRDRTKEIALEVEGVKSIRDEDIAVLGRI